MPPLIHPSRTVQANGQNFRLRLNHVGSEYTAKDIEAEIQFGRNLAAKILKQYPLLRNNGVQEYINLVGSGLANQVGRPELTYYFAVIQSDEVNAYACPGGYIFITKKALDLMKNEAQLAGVIAHEIAHVNYRHVVKALNIRGQSNSWSSGISTVFGGASASTRILINQLTEKAFKLLFEEGVSKEGEFQSDQFSMMVLTTLRYDRESYLAYLKELGHEISGKKEAVISKTHPPVAERISSLRQDLKKHNMAYKQGTKNVARFQDYIPF